MDVEIYLKNPTNAEYIRNMTEDEMAEYFSMNDWDGCPPSVECDILVNGWSIEDCIECWKKWLKEPKK